MSDSNMISIAITLFAIAAGSLFNNLRISDLASAANKRFDDMRDFIRSENTRIDQKLDRIAETLSAMLGDHEQRLRSIEQQRPHG
jgi:hypothetical protein